MTKSTNGLLILTSVTLLAVSVGAQQSSGQTKPPQPGTQGQMSMGDMMKGCREHCERSSKAMEQISSAVEAVKASTDPAAMRSSMDRIEKSLADMREHMGMCMRMMDMKQGMPAMGGMMGQPPAPSSASAAKTGLDIAFSTQPSPARTGDNIFEVILKGPDGMAVTDATVTARFYMAAMPSMNMPEMRSAATLKHVSAGRYRGNGNIAMGGRWEVTVVVMKAGKEIGSRTVTITAR